MKQDQYVFSEKWKVRSRRGNPSTIYNISGSKLQRRNKRKSRKEGN
jgi:hypothetical protein